MRERSTGWIVLAILLHGAHGAHAGCPVALEGEAAVVEPIRSELSLFEDDGAPCVAVWVACHADGDHVDLELRDELGRSCPPTCPRMAS